MAHVRSCQRQLSHRAVPAEDARCGNSVARRVSTARRPATPTAITSSSAPCLPIGATWASCCGFGPGCAEAAPQRLTTMRTGLV